VLIGTGGGAGTTYGGTNVGNGTISGLAATAATVTQNHRYGDECDHVSRSWARFRERWERRRWEVPSPSPNSISRLRRDPRLSPSAIRFTVPTTPLTLPTSAIPITGFADGATNQTFNWNVLSGTAPVITQVAARKHDHVDWAGWQQQRFAGEFQHRFGRHDYRLVQQRQDAGAGTIGAGEFRQRQRTPTRRHHRLLTPTLASGPAVVGVPGAGGLGTLSGGSLELSNVDIATEFANLIVAQRGFEADAKAVTTFDQITQDTIALKQ
jgi:hypothetical protein